MLKTLWLLIPLTCTISVQVTHAKSGNAPSTLDVSSTSRQTINFEYLTIKDGLPDNFMEQIRAHDATAADALKRLADDFEYGKISTLMPKGREPDG